MIMHRSQKILILFSVWILLSSCGTDPVGTNVSPIAFSPNPAPATVGTCTSQAQVLSVASQTVVLVALSARFEDANGQAASFSMSAETLEANFDTVVLSGNGVALANLAFDLGSQGLSFPATGTIVVTGTNASGVTEFIGSLTCNA